MKKKRVLSLGLAAALFAASALPQAAFGAGTEGKAALVHMETNRLDSPLGVDVGTKPVFGWAIQSEARGVKQGAWQIVVKEQDKGNVVWDSGKVSGDQTQDIVYGGEALKPQTAYTWTATSWDGEGREIAGAEDSFETGLDPSTGWDGVKWIALDEEAVDYGVDSYTVSGKIRFDTKIEGTFASLVYGYRDVNHYYYVKFIQNKDGSVSCAPGVETGTTQAQFSDTTIMIIDESNTDFDPENLPADAAGDAALNWKVEEARADEAFTAAVHVDVKNQAVSVEVNGKEVGRFSKPKYFYKTGKNKSTIWNGKPIVYGYEKGELVENVKLLPLAYGRIGLKQSYNAGLEALTVSYDDIQVETVETGGQEAKTAYSYSFEDGTAAFNYGTITEKDGGHWLTVTTPPGNYDLLAVQEDFEGQSAPMLRKKFTPKGEVASARLYATSLGLYDAYINGQRVGTMDPETGKTVYDELKPDWTVYGKQVSYNTYDVTDYLKTGENILGASLGTGWYQGRISRNSYYPESLQFLAKLVVSYKDGSVEEVVTDGSWQSYDKGPVTFNDIWDGERYDANKEVAWEDDGDGWRPVAADYQYEGKITPQMGEPVRVVKELTDVALIDSNQEKTYLLYDFKQNFAGRENLTIKAAPGTRIELKHAEVLNDQVSAENGKTDGPVGTVYTGNLRSAKAKEVYVVGESGVVRVCAAFTFFGFRYLDIHASAPVEVSEIKGEVLSSDLEETMSFTTDNEKVNQLASNIIWSQIGNYISVPTDCPQRDERWGYSGDANVFAATGAYNLDIANFMKRFTLTSSDAAERYKGLVPAVVPEVGANSGYWGWADSAVIVPWKCYLQYGSVEDLRTSYKTMKDYLTYMETYTPRDEAAGPAIHEDGSVAGHTLGDHLAPEASEYGDAFTGTKSNQDVLRHLIATYDVSIMKQASEILGYKEDAAHYGELYTRLRTYFRKTYVTEDGTLTDNTQGAYAIALSIGMFEEEEKAAAADAMAACVAQTGSRISTGFLTTNWLLPALSQNGKTGVAYDLLLQEMAPSWLYEVNQGATTMWERWNSYSDKTGFADTSMTSFNHYAYGSVGEWLYGYMAGIVSGEEAGYQEFILQPAVDPKGRIHTVEARYESDYGTIRSAWKAAEGEMSSYTATVPANTTATLYLPVGARKLASVPENAVYVKEEKRNGISCAVYELISGTYEFILLDQQQYEVIEQETEKAKAEAERAKAEAEAAKQQAQEADRKAEEARKQAEAAKAAQEAAEKAAAEAKAAVEKAAKETKEALAQAKAEAETKAAEAQKAKAEAEAKAAAAQEARQAAQKAKKNYEDAREKVNFQAQKVVLKSVKSNKKKQAVVKWKKVSGAEGYQIQYSLKSSMKNAKTLTLKGNKTFARTIKKGLKSKKKVYVRVKAYKTIGGKKIYSVYSAKKSVKVK